MIKLLLDLRCLHSLLDCLDEGWLFDCEEGECSFSFISQNLLVLFGSLLDLGSVFFPLFLLEERNSIKHELLLSLFENKHCLFGDLES